MKNEAHRKEGGARIPSNMNKNNGFRFSVNVCFAMGGLERANLLRISPNSLLRKSKPAANPPIFQLCNPTRLELEEGEWSLTQTSGNLGSPGNFYHLLAN